MSAPPPTTAPRSRQSEKDRILSVPVQRLPDPVPDLSSAFRKPGGTMSLREIQSTILYVAWQVARDYPGQDLGMLVSAGVGAGKTLASYLLPLAAGIKRPLLLVPAKLEEKTHIDFNTFRPHWKDPPPITVMSYESLSSKRASGILHALQPDGVMCDEAHKLKNVTAARTKRVLRFAGEHPAVRWFFLSGTLMDSEIQDAVHLAALALRGFSPLPRNSHFQEVMAWAQVLNVTGNPGPSDYGFVRPIHDAWAGKDANWSGTLEERRTACRRAYFRRFKATPGAVATEQSAFGGALNITLRLGAPRLPPEVASVMAYVNETWETPDGKGVFTDAREVSRVQNQLACGFWYRWAWEKIRSGGPDHEWMSRRRAWAAEVRDWLGGSSLPPVGLDSEALVAEACNRGDSRLPRSMREAWAEWSPVRDRWLVDYDHKGGDRKIPVVPVWISEFLIDDALEWAGRQDEPAILWYDYRALEGAFKRRARHGDLVVYDRGHEPPQVKGAPVPRVSAMSVLAHGEGKNLQHGWACQLFTRAFSNGKLWEQALGRTHRPGQLADEVQAHVNLHTQGLRDAFKSAQAKARFLQDNNGGPQKILYATYVQER